MLHFVHGIQFSDSLDRLGLDDESAMDLVVEIEERCRARVALAARGEAMLRFCWGPLHLWVWYLANGPQITLDSVMPDPAGQKR